MTILSPQEAIFWMVMNCEDCPDDTASEPVPPSRAAILFSNTSVVGLDIRVYMCPSAFRLKRSAACCVLLNIKDVVW